MTEDKALIAEVRVTVPHLSLRDMSIKALMLCDRLEHSTAEVERLQGLLNQRDRLHTQISPAAIRAEKDKT